MTSFLDSSNKISASNLQTGNIQITLTSASINSGTSISPDFMGLMFPLTDVTAVIGNSSTNLNPIFQNLLGQLTQYSSAPMIIRIGNSTLNYTTQRKGALAGLANATNIRYVLGVNMLKTNTSYYTDTVAPLLTAIPASSLYAIENGNEADLFKNIPNWDYNSFLTQFGTFQGYMNNIGQPKLAAPVWSGTQSAFNNTNLNSFVNNNASRLTFVDMHNYATSSCTTPPGVGVLLAENQVSYYPGYYASSITTAHSKGLDFRLTEWNSSSCGGAPNVSNAFESALWFLDGAYRWINVGLDGVNLTNNNASSFYSPYYFHSTSTSGIYTYSLDSVMPIYYGMKMFMQSVQKNAKLVSVQTVNTNNYNVKAWVTVDQVNTVRVLLINKDDNFAGTVDVTLGGYSSGKGYRLTAPSYSSKTGVTYAGQTYDGSVNGNPIGTQITETYTSPTGQTGHYFVSFTKPGAVLIEFDSVQTEISSNESNALKVIVDKGKIRISSTDAIRNVIITDICGKALIIKNGQFNYEETIDVSPYKGIYLIKIETVLGVSSQKLLLH